MPFSPPNRLFHETTTEAFKSIKQIGLQPYVGAVVQHTDHYDPEIESAQQGVVFMSDDDHEHGYYCLWQIQHLLGKDRIDDVTLADLKKYGVLLVIDPKNDLNEDVIFRNVGDGEPEVVNMRGEKVKFVENENRDEIPVRKLPSSIERGDYFALQEVTYDRAITGEALIKYLRNSKNHAIVRLFSSLKQKVASKYEIAAVSAEIARFIRIAADVLKKHRVDTPDGSYWTCSEVSHSLAKIAEKVGIEATPMGALLMYPDGAHYVDAGLKGEPCGHTLLLLNAATLVDFTLRQFLPKSPYPFVASLESAEAKRVYGTILPRPRGEGKRVPCGMWVSKAMEEIEKTLEGWATK